MGYARYIRCFEDATSQLSKLMTDRLKGDPIMMTVKKVRFPVALFFIRGDRGGEGKELAEQVVASFDYWNIDSGKYIDIVFPGWNKKGDSVVFSSFDFLRFKEQIERTSTWRYSGETDIVLLNYDFHFSQLQSPLSFIGKGEFAFDQVILLNVEEMLREGRVNSLDAFIHQLIQTAKEVDVRSDDSVLWDIDKKIAFYRGRKVLWEVLKETKWLKHISKVYDELHYFRMSDMRLKKTRKTSGRLR